MIYLEHSPAPPLDRSIASLWYARAPRPTHERERILPTGRVQVILNLERDYLHDCAEGEPDRRTAPALVVGARSVFEIVSTRDMADLIGMVFEPGGFARFAGDAADLFSNRSFDLETIWGAEAKRLRETLQEAVTPGMRLRLLEEFLLGRLAMHGAGGALGPHAAVEYALERFRQGAVCGSVAEVARETGWSERRFSQVFREQVGLAPKVWCRVQRFQRAVRQLHAGGKVRWDELALECGFYDQSHFANEFRAFSEPVYDLGAR